MTPVGARGMPPRVVPSRHPWPRGLPREAVDHVLVVLSDIEIGAGGPTDSHPDTAYLEALLAAYQAPPYDDVAVTFVLNGDTLDFLKVPPEDGSFPTHLTEEMSLAKLNRIAAAHPSFFDALGRLLTDPPAPRELVLIAGNHDQDLFFDGVWARLAELLGSPEGLRFEGVCWRVGDVLLEHGSQHDPMFAIDPEHPLLEHEGRTLLNLPWGTLAITEVLMPYLPLLHPLDQLLPHRAVLAAAPEVEELLLSAFWRYWTRDYWARFFERTDPLRHVSWTMLKQVGYRFGTGDPDARSAGDREVLRLHPDSRVLCMGHLHEPRLESMDGRRLLRTGCLRDEYLADLERGEHRLLTKSYAEIFLRESRTVRSRLVEVDAPQPASTGLPRDFGAIEREARALRLRDPEASELREARDAQTRTEGRAKTEVAPGFFRTLWNALQSDR